MNTNKPWLADTFEAARNHRISDPEWSRGLCSVFPFKEIDTTYKQTKKKQRNKSEVEFEMDTYDQDN